MTGEMSGRAALLRRLARMAKWQLCRTEVRCSAAVVEKVNLSGCAWRLAAGER